MRFLPDRPGNGEDCAQCQDSRKGNDGRIIPECSHFEECGTSGRALCPIGDLLFNRVMVLTEECTVFKDRSMALRSETRRKMTFDGVRKRLHISEKQNRKARGERVPRRGVSSTTVINNDGEIPLPPKTE